MQHALDLIPDLSETSITARTSSDWISKAILISQLTWFCVNFILRLAQHLTRSLLEAVTLAHCLITMVTCLCWWSKPFHVQSPTIISGSRAREVCALLTMYSEEYQSYLGPLA